MPPEDVEIRIPIVGSGVNGDGYPIAKAQCAEWQELFPLLDVAGTLREIRAWNLANPTRRKTASGVPRHVVAWLTREQNKGGGSGCGADAGGPRSWMPRNGTGGL